MPECRNSRVKVSSSLQSGAAGHPLVRHCAAMQSKILLLDKIFCMVDTVRILIIINIFCPLLHTVYIIQVGCVLSVLCECTFRCHQLSALLISQANFFLHSLSITE
jgi:hypothetical protein